MHTNRLYSLFSWLCLGTVLTLCRGDVFAQTAFEQPSQQNRFDFPVVWPKGPGRDSVPAWAAPGKVRFARWDGGRI